MAGPWEAYQTPEQAAPEQAPWKSYQEPPPPEMSWSDWGRAGMTAAVRGLTALPDALADPLAPLRRLVSPDLERIEKGNDTDAAMAYMRSYFPNAPPAPPAPTPTGPGKTDLPPWLESTIGALGTPPGQAVGNAVFSATGVPEYQPTTPGGRVAMSAAQGGIAGAPLGPLPALLGLLGGTTGQITQEATGNERLSALAGLAPGGALTALGARASSRMTPELEAAGINPTIGQALGGWANRLEQGFGSIPILGDFIKSGRAGAIEDFNRGAINMALDHIGEKLDRGTPLGRAAIDEAAGKIGGAYDRITPQLNVTLDPQFGTGLTDIFRRSNMLSRDHQQQLGNTVRTEIMDRLNGPDMTGQAFRDAESTLGQITRENRTSPLPADRAYGNAIQDLQTELRDLLRRSNPDQAAQLQDIHNAYRTMLPVEIAAARMGTGLGGHAEAGVFTPSQLTSGVRQADPTLRNRGFARGNAVLQDYAESGRTLLGDTLPDSGTPYRGFVGLGGLGAAGSGGVAAGLLNPMTLGLGLAGAGGAGFLYSPAGRAAMNYFLRRPEQAGLGLLANPVERR